MQTVSLKELVSINTALQKAILKEEKTVNSFKEYYDIIEEKSKNGNTFTKFFFRGHANKKYDKPTPSVYRDANTIKKRTSYIARLFVGINHCLLMI